MVEPGVFPLLALDLPRILRPPWQPLLGWQQGVQPMDSHSWRPTALRASLVLPWVLLLPRLPLLELVPLGLELEWLQEVAPV